MVAGSESSDSGAGAGNVLRGALIAATIAMAIRSPGIARPLGSPFATKNAVYGMTSRNWARGVAPLHEPTLDVLVGGKRSLHLVEYPVPALLATGAWKISGGSVDVWLRAQGILWSGVAAGFLYALARRWFGACAAKWSAFAFVVSPVGIIYGQCAMLEPAVAAWMVMAIYAVDVWRGRGSARWLTLTGVSLCALLLTKIYMLVVLAPIAWEMRRYKRRWLLVGVILLAAAPAILWNAWAWSVSAPGSADVNRIYFSLRDSFATVESPTLLKLGFYLGFAKDLLLRPLGPVAFLGVLVGAFDARARRLAPWLLAMGLLVIAMPRKFHEMEYYFLILAPVLCLLAGLGWDKIAERLRETRWVLLVAALIWIGINARLSVSKAFFTPAEDRAVIPAAQAARALLAPNEPIVTMHGTGIYLLYHCDAPGWAISPDDPRLEKRVTAARQEGARYLVFAGEIPASMWLKGLTGVRAGDGFAIYRIAEQESR